ncbi:hypothetical protein [Chitinimonas koreensis]|uniref:hypothetical protein n=1 Tax=Chitinimonas koreensis TaxID=356302 RepID=UPI0004163EC8|nr:hypothetical protein [Chitinimonas koreensis]QNM98195.1 hypothetical protein H9L41_08115 [Chitinimonas koreensis]
MQADQPSFYTPESLFTPSSAAPPGIPYDALVCALDRARAVLTLLSQQFDGGSCDRLGDEILALVVDDAMGNVKLARKMVEFAEEELRLSRMVRGDRS